MEIRTSGFSLMIKQLLLTREAGPQLKGVDPCGIGSWSQRELTNSSAQQGICQQLCALVLYTCMERLQIPLHQAYDSLF